MTENEITGDILDASIKLHKKFGAGLLESVYETLLEIELKKRGHKVERQIGMSTLKEGFLRFVNNFTEPQLRASAPLREDNPTATSIANMCF